ncbi:IbrB-like domain-containing protein [Streptomyces tubercidicus]
MSELDLLGMSIVEDAKELFARLADIPEDDRIAVINALRLEIHQHSPMKAEPVDCVQWVPADEVRANDYNPNVVAPPEMRLLQRSIMADGYTQPIVVGQTENAPATEATYEVVDGFHRNRVGREVAAVRRRVRGRLPVAVINADRTDRSDRMAATIRHNRARGVHTVDGTSDMVLELARRGKSDEWIASELGMDPDQVLRLKQTQGLAELFADQEFSEAFEAADPWEHPDSNAV